jgi:hypothetical protein
MSEDSRTPFRKDFRLLAYPLCFFLSKYEWQEEFTHGKGKEILPENAQPT